MKTPTEVSAFWRGFALKNHDEVVRLAGITNQAETRISAGGLKTEFTKHHQKYQQCSVLHPV